VFLRVFLRCFWVFSGVLGGVWVWRKVSPSVLGMSAMSDAEIQR
jgi:hypothetical protein